MGSDAAMKLEDLEPLVGRWTTVVSLPGADGVVSGRTSFVWLERGGYLVQRSEMDDARFPQTMMVIGPTADGSRIVGHYFDSRGVARVYEISLAAGALRLWRDGPDFAQRYSAQISADGTTIDGAWEIRDDDAGWRHDFDMCHERVGSGDP